MFDLTAPAGRAVLEVDPRAVLNSAFAMPKSLDVPASALYDVVSPGISFTSVDR